MVLASREHKEDKHDVLDWDCVAPGCLGFERLQEGDDPFATHIRNHFRHSHQIDPDGYSDLFLRPFGTFKLDIFSMHCYTLLCVMFHQMSIMIGFGVLIGNIEILVAFEARLQDGSASWKCGSRDAPKLTRNGES